MRVSGTEYVRVRAATWFSRALRDAGVSKYRLGQEYQKRTGVTSGVDSPIREMLAKKRPPSPTTAFEYGQALALATVPKSQKKNDVAPPYVPRPAGHPELRGYVKVEVGERQMLVPGYDERPVVPGGLFALHGVGHIREAAAVTLAMLRSKSEGDRVYAARFAAVVWIIHADLDGLEEEYPQPLRRSLANIVGDAHVDAIDYAWSQRKKLDRYGRAVLSIGEEESLSDKPTYIAMWTALIEKVATQSYGDAALMQWRRNALPYFLKWKEVMRNRRDAALDAAQFTNTEALASES